MNFWFDRKCEKRKDDIKSLLKGNSFNPSDRQLKEKFNQRLKEYKIMCTAKVHGLELWNNNTEQLEDNMLKSDTSFGAVGRISLKK